MNSSATEAPDDQMLLNQIGEGSEPAMESFYKRHSDAVYRFAYKTLQNPVDAAEVMNEVMLTVWQKPFTFKGKSKVTTWLYGITHNKAVDAVRKNARHDHVGEFDPEQAEHSQSENDDACELFEAQQGLENASYVKTCMDKLSNSHRQVVYLTFFEGLSYPEIANVVAVPAGTVKTRMMHAKQLLLKCLQRLLGSE